VHQGRGLPAALLIVLAGDVAHEVHGHDSDGGHCLAMAGREVHGAVVQDNVEQPMSPIFLAPLCPDSKAEGWRIHQQVGRVTSSWLW